MLQPKDFTRSEKICYLLLFENLILLSRTTFSIFLHKIVRYIISFLWTQFWSVLIHLSFLLICSTIFCRGIQQQLRKFAKTMILCVCCLLFSIRYHKFDKIESNRQFRHLYFYRIIVSKKLNPTYIHLLIKNKVCSKTSNNQDK